MLMLQSKVPRAGKSNNSRVVKCDICYNILYNLTNFMKIKIFKALCSISWANRYGSV